MLLVLLLVLLLENRAFLLPSRAVPRRSLKSAAAAVSELPPPLTVPRHVAYIIDGNGRWAAKQGLDRLHGHTKGAAVTVEVAKRSFECGVDCVTLYLFSTENWSRPSVEVQNIMLLLEQYLASVATYLLENGIRLSVIGQLHRLPLSCQLLIQQLSSRPVGTTTTSKTLCLALSYGGRDDIVQACREIVITSTKAEDIDESFFGQHTSTGRLGIPDPDLIVRTSGEFRLSNFLLWQAAYAELESVDKLWPDFSPDEAEFILRGFSKRQRRYGR